ncbi:DUF1684 domain-containing protein [Mucilaginibacter sp. AW1-3]
MKKHAYLLLAFVLIVHVSQSFAQSFDMQIATFRKSYMADFLTDKSSPLKEADLQYLRFYAPDSTYRIVAKVTYLQNVPAFIMPVTQGTGREHIAYAKLSFTLKNKLLELTVYRNTALAKMPALKDYLFLPFNDSTNGNETYGGGRYIDLRESDFKNDTLVLDFNKAYNPYCAFGGEYSCPKPPDENHLSVAIEAGEKKFGKTH